MYYEILFLYYHLFSYLDLFIHASLQVSRDFMSYLVETFPDVILNEMYETKAGNFHSGFGVVSI